MELGPDEGLMMAATAIARAVDEARSNTPGAGTQVGRYVLVEPLGAGGMGVVYRAYDPKLRREIAIKHIAPKATHCVGDQMLVREARAMAQLRHRHVVSVFDVEVSQAGVFLVMELVPGPDACAWLKTKRSSREILKLFVEAGEGLTCAHAAGLVHRDFKPANVLVDPARGGRVSDFGLAKAVEPASDGTQPQRVAPPSTDRDDEVTADESTWSSTSPSCAGTPRYMAPEQHRGEHVDARADQFAFCVALWEALTGEAPYRGDVRRLASAKMSGPPAWPRTRGVRAGVAAALRKGLSPAPEDRFASMDALLRQLQPRRTRRRAGALAIAAATSVGLVVGTADASTPPCRSASRLMVQTWNDETRSAVREVFDASVRDLAPARDLVLSQFDDFAAQWIAERRDACEATAVRREQSERVLELRTKCLDHQRESFGDLIGALASNDADPDAARLGHRAVASLPRTERCADVGALARDPRPTDRERAELVAELEGELEALRARTMLGQIDEARARALLERAVASKWSPTEAKARALVSLSLAHARDFEAAAEEGERAWRLALQSDHPVLAAQAGSLAGAIRSVDDPEQGVRLATAALDLAIGRELPKWLLASLHANLAKALLNAGETAQATEHLQQSVALRTEFGSSSFELAAPRIPNTESS